MTSLPPELQYGHVVGRVILAVADSGDADAYPDAVPAQGTVTFTPKNPEVRVGEPDPVVVLKQKIVCTIDSAGYLTDPDGKRGVWLVTGVYTVSYTFNAAALPAHDIVVGAEHSLASPLDLTLALPPGGPVLQPSQYAELTARIDALGSGSGGTGAVSSVNGKTGAVVLGASDVGALPSTYTPPAQSWTQITSKPATFPPAIGTTATTAKAGNYVPAWGEVTGKPTTFTPTAHAATHAAGGSDPITPESIGAAPDDHGHDAAAITDLTETVQDIVGALIAAGTGTTVSYDDAAGTVTINATATGGSTDPEIVRDVIGSAIVAGSGIQAVVDDAGDTITLSSTAVLPTRKVLAGTGLTGGGDLAADRTLSVSYGTTAGTAAQGNDARLSDARTPTAHAHAAADVTSGTFTPDRLGTGTASASTVLYGDGAWKPAPTGGGGGGEAHPLPGIRPWEWRHTLCGWDGSDTDLPYGHISAVPIWLDAGNYQTAYIQVRSGGGPSTLVRLGIYDGDENLVGDFGTAVANGEGDVNISATVTVPTTGWHLAAAVAQGTDSPVQVQRGLPIHGVAPGTDPYTRYSPGGRLRYTTRTYLGALPTSLASDSRQQYNWPIPIAFRRSPA